MVLNSLRMVRLIQLAAGNPAPRVHPIAQGMINAVGLQGSGVNHWIENDLPAMAAVNATAVVSIWGRSVEEYRDAAQLLHDGLARSSHRSTVIAVEINLSCPNMHGHGIFNIHCGPNSVQIPIE
jgi:dihydroorotate dehydrogenase (NAD+) catalytic subunit